MDNQSNQNWPNNPTTAPPSNGTSALPTNPTTSTPVNPTTPPVTQPEPTPSAPPTEPAPWTITPAPATQSDLTPAPEPAVSLSSSLPQTGGDPVPTFPPVSQSPDTSSSPGTSPLDNPWGAPAQAPPIDRSPQNPPSTWPASPEPTSYTSSPTPAESVPTDLSHLISNNSPEGTNPAGTDPNTGGPTTSAPTSAETLVVPPTTGTVPEVPSITAEGHQGIPKWLIGVGIGLLIIVAGASAYFILGIGQPPKTTSVPAEVTKQTVKTPPPIATPAPQPSPAAEATGSANFGQLQGGGSSPQATSAADLLRQRQQTR